MNQFKDFDRVGEGHVTRSQFARVMQTLGLMSHDETTIDLLCKRYCDKGMNFSYHRSQFLYLYPSNARQCY